MAELKIRWATPTGSHTFTLDQAETCTLGREEGNAVTLPDSQVSRQHAKIFWEDNQFILKNISSKNPVALHIAGETHIIKPGEQRVLLTDGVLFIKPYKLQLDLIGAGLDIQLQVECPNCSKVNEGDAAFCKWCGQSLTGSNTVDIRR